MTQRPIEDFKLRTLNLIAELRLTDEEVVGLGISLAVAHGVVGVVAPAALHRMVDEALVVILGAVEEVVLDVRH